MFLKRNRAGMMAVSVAASLVMGEAIGFSSSFMSGMWPWMMCVAVFVVFVAVGWSLPSMRWIVSALVGVSLAWRCESRRLSVERDRRGFPPAYELVVEGDVSCRRRGVDGRIVRFRSSVCGVPVRVVAAVDGNAEIPAQDETWRCSGWMSLKRGAPNRYSCRTLWVTNGGRMERVAVAGDCATGTIYGRVSDFLSRLAGTGIGWNPELASINKAMLLGRRGEISAERRAMFAAAGTIHVFAISGLHVMLVAGVLKMLLEKTGLPSFFQASLAIPLLSAYVMLTGARPSAVRAALMMSLWLGAGIFGRRPDSLAAWGIAAFAVYAISPAMVFDAGCALSFAVMLGIVLWIRWSSQFSSFAGLMFKSAAEEASLCGDSGDIGAVCLSRCHSIAGWVFGALGISLSSWIAGTPLSAMIFGRISVGGIFANVFVVPLSAMAVVFSAVGAFASFVFAPLGALFNNMAAGCAWGMRFVSETVAGCPGASFDTLPWRWWECVIWYASWMVLFAVIARHLPQREEQSLLKSWQK